jgi:hypothetical protein
VKATIRPNAESGRDAATRGAGVATFTQTASAVTAAPVEPAETVAALGAETTFSAAATLVTGAAFVPVAAGAGTTRFARAFTASTRAARRRLALPGTRDEVVEIAKAVATRAGTTPRTGGAGSGSPRTTLT